MCTNLSSKRKANIPDKILDYQERAEKTINTVTSLATSGDTMQLKLMLPRLMNDIRAGASVMDKINVSDKPETQENALHKNISMQYVTALRNEIESLNRLYETLSQALQLADLSENEVRMADVIDQCQKLRSAGEAIKNG